MTEIVEENAKLHFLKEVTLGNLMSVFIIVATTIFSYATLNTDVKALAQRADKADKIEERNNGALDTLKGSVVRIEAEQQNVRKDQDRLAKQLDRIEYLLRGGSPPPPKTP